MNTPVPPPYPPASPANRPTYLPLPFARPRWTYILLGLNVAIWLVELGAYTLTGYDIGTILILLGAKVNLLVAQGEYWRLLTAMFLHDAPQPLHLFFNMYALYILGPQIEATYGRTRFITIYLLSGLAGSVLSYAFGAADVPSVGASGAIFGLVGALIAYAYRYRDHLHRARQQLMNAIAIVLINFLFGLSLPGIDNWAHLGGLMGGVVTGALLVPYYEVEYMGLEGQPTVVDRNSLRRQSLAILAVIAALVVATFYITRRWGI